MKLHQNTRRVLAGACWLAGAGPAGATILTFQTSPRVVTYATMPQDYGDNVSATSMTSASGTYQNFYAEGNGFTPNISVAYSTQRPGDFPEYYGEDPGGEWVNGACFLWSHIFRTDADPRVIGVPGGTGEVMPPGYEYYFTFTPASANAGVLINSFVLDDYIGWFDEFTHQIEWRITRLTPGGAVVASGTANITGGANVTVTTGLTAASVTGEPLVLTIKRMGGVEDDFAIDDINFDEVRIATVAVNSGSLGPAGNGENNLSAAVNQPGALAEDGDRSTGYSGGNPTVVPYAAALNPPAASPFTVEFWAMPSGSDNDDAPLSNRQHNGDRSGWVFFQRSNAWNVRLYSGAGSAVGFAQEGNIAGNPSTVGVWSHVVAVWTGSTMQLYVNGAAVTAAVTGSGVYEPNGPGVNLAIGGHDYGGGGSSPYEGLVDEVAWYPTALSAAKIMEHYTTAASLTAGAYSRLVFRDGAAEHLRQTTASSPPALAIGSMARAADGSSVTFNILNTRPNRNYTVYYSTALKSA